MATKAKAKQFKMPKKNEWTAKEKQVFKELGIGEGEVTLRKLISGQRKINGRLYKAIDLIGEGLKADRKGDSKKHNDCVDRACKINDEIPGTEPPYCDDRGL
jgi:hypothetical protein